ncbi:hypothetical protein LSTR_LSTR014476 [Laodelphax striatellus]|uniref:Uncharacterized protein n=1 Tax=Laodelphax striatellus TaxID=195883 RepID=A0A482WKJ9_LAOST|nr:hypothetical protein LSTR_LSTR014476 [Laodelphax striatellus]
MSSTKIIPRNHFHCTIEGHGDFIRPTDISYKKYPSNNIKKLTPRPPCKKGRRNENELKNPSVKQIQRTSSYQNLSEEQNKGFELYKSNSKSCENVTLIGKLEQSFLIGLRRKSQTNIMKGPEDEPHTISSSAEGDTQRAVPQADEAIMRKTLTNLIINAWRNQANQTAKLKEENELLKKQETELGILKQQLEEERQKVAELNIENMKSKLNEVESLRKIEKLRSVDMQRKQEIDTWKSRLDDKEIEYENAKNNSLQLEKEAETTKKELNEEREQKDKLQKEKKNLMEKVSSLEFKAIEKNATLLEEIGKLKKEISSKEREVDGYRTVIKDMEMFILAKEENIAAIKKVSDAYMMEVTKIRLSNNSDAAKKLKTADDNWTSTSSIVRTAVFFMLPLMKKLIFP